MTVSVRTLELRAAARAAQAQADTARRAEAASNYALRLRQANRPNKCRVYFCDACGTVFDETEGIERPSGWLACPDCGMEVS
jgi:rubrerythrin